MKTDCRSCGCRPATAGVEKGSDNGRNTCKTPVAVERRRVVLISSPDKERREVMGFLKSLLSLPFRLMSTDLPRC